MRSYIKLYGPPVYAALKALEKMSIDVQEVCVMDPLIRIAVDNAASEGVTLNPGEELYPSVARNYFDDINDERCESIISRNREMLTEYDFFFEWLQKPSVDELKNLINKIDVTLANTKVRYSITTK